MEYACLDYASKCPEGSREETEAEDAGMGFDESMPDSFESSRKTLEGDIPISAIMKRANGPIASFESEHRAGMHP
jgi:hypothetical protein